MNNVEAPGGAEVIKCCLTSAQLRSVTRAFTHSACTQPNQELKSPGGPQMWCPTTVSAMSLSQLYDLLHAANYFGIIDLVNMCTEAVASMVRVAIDAEDLDSLLQILSTFPDFCNEKVESTRKDRAGRKSHKGGGDLLASCCWPSWVTKL